MNTVIHPGIIHGSIAAPPSKSLTQRAIAAGVLAGGKTIIRNPSFCDDSIAAIGIARDLGADISTCPDHITIDKGAGIISSTVNLNCVESGLALRMFSPVAAAIASHVTLSGGGSLTRRPVTMISEALPQFGVKVETTDGYLPLCLTGRLAPGRAVIDGSSGSQLLTGLLMALPVLNSDSEILVKNLKSRPYINLTLKLLEAFSVNIINDGFTLFSIPGNQSYRPHEYIVEGDWSGSAFLLVAGAVAGEVTVSNLSLRSAQADRAVLEALGYAGATVSCSDSKVTVTKSDLKAFTFDATDCPDLFPPLAALAAYCRGKTRIKGAGRLAIKESDRARAITKVLSELNIRAVVADDEMIIEGGVVNGSLVSSYNDHRIAMMAAVIALGSKGEVTINGAESVAKSFPDFFSTLSQLGVVLSKQSDSLLTSDVSPSS